MLFTFEYTSIANLSKAKQKLVVTVQYGKSMVFNKYSTLH